MAIVENAARDDAFTDRPMHTYNRTNAGTPNGTLTPQWVGEIVFDTTNKVRWRAVGAANTDWTPLGPEVT